MFNIKRIIAKIFPKAFPRDPNTAKTVDLDKKLLSTWEGEGGSQPQAKKPKRPGDFISNRNLQAS